MEGNGTETGTITSGETLHFEQGTGIQVEKTGDNQLTITNTSPDVNHNTDINWDASTVSQLEAETGTATTDRKWTAQRVLQAIQANSINSYTNTTYSAGTALDLSGTVFNIDLSELTTTTSSNNADFMIALNHFDGIYTQYKIPTTDIDLSRFNNDSGFVTSSGNTIIGTDSDIDTSAATVIDQLNMTDGVITSHSTRELTLADLGYTGATNATANTGNITSVGGGTGLSGYGSSGSVTLALDADELQEAGGPSIYFVGIDESGNTVKDFCSSFNSTTGTDSDINTSGASVVDQLNLTDGVITSHSTRELTASDIGAASSSHAHSGADITSGTVAFARIHDDAKAWHGHSRIIIKPSDFIPNDDQSYYNVAMVDNGGKIKVTSSSLEAYAQYEIPNGYKATHVKLYGNNSQNTMNVYEHSISTTTATSRTSGFAEVNTENNITDIVGSNTTYMSVRWNPSATSDYLYGGYITLREV